MVIADPSATLLTVCENGYGKRTPFGPNEEPGVRGQESEVGEGEAPAEPPPEEDSIAAEDESEETSSSQRYPTKGRGGIGVRDIKTTERNGLVIGIARVDDRDEILMMTSRGKIQRIKAADISVISRNTQGVRIMSLDEGDSLVAVVRVPPEEAEAGGGATEA
jgi:DNA gyrase subunit A